MSITVIVEVEAVPGKEEELATRLTELCVETRTRPGCESLSLHRDQEAPGRVVGIERWEARADHEAYMAWRAERGDAGALGPIMANLIVRYFDDI